MHTARRTARGNRRRRSGNPLFGQLLTAAVESAADAVSIRAYANGAPDGVRELSYREFDEESSRLARELIARGVGAGDVVAVGMHRSIESVLAVWAIAKTGAACAPVDPGRPADELARGLAESGAALGLTSSGYRADLGDGIEWLELDDPHTDARIAAWAAHPISYTDRVRPLTEQHPAYLVRSAGASVVVTHTGLATVVNAMREQLGVDGEARLAQLGAPDSDLAVLELLLTFSSGAMLVLAPPEPSGAELADLLRRERITHLLISSAVFDAVDPAGLDELEAVAVIGARFDPETIGRWTSERRAVHTAYGLPETTMLDTVGGPVQPGEDVTIGAPIMGIGAFVLDSRLRPVPAGMVGELYLSGPVLAQGYSGRPGTTASRFVASLFGAETGQPGLRLFRTGDLVRRNDSDGSIEFVAHLPEPASALRGPIASALLERAVADTFGALLSSADAAPRPIEATDDFFELGGDVPLAGVAAARIGAALGLWIPGRFVFEARTVAGLAERIARHVDAVTARELRPMPRPERIPMSYVQQRIWSRNRFDPTSPTDNIPVALRLGGRLDIDALRAAVRDLVVRHEVLRTVFPEFRGTGYQLVLPTADPRATPEVPVVRAAEDELLGLVSETVGAGFDVTAESPIRLRVLSSGDTDHVLVCVLHRIAADSFSTGPLTRDLMTAYRDRARGAQPQWPPLEVQYADYALWQREVLGAEDDPDSIPAQQIEFWRTELSGLHEQAELPADQPRPPIASQRGATLEFELDPRVHAVLNRVAHEHGATLFTVLHVMLAILLARLSGNRDIAIAAPVTGRGAVALDEVVGIFANILVLRANIAPGAGFAELLTTVRDADLAALANADVPFEQLAEELDPVRSAARHPLCQVALTLRNTARTRPELPGLTVEDIEFDTARAEFDLLLTMTERLDEYGVAQGMTARFTYATDLFDDATVRDFAHRFGRVIDAVTADDRVIVGDIDVLMPGERELVLREWNTAGVTVPPLTLVDLISERARERPGAIAVRAGEVAVGFGELMRRANRVARALIARGVGPESLVAVAVERNTDLPVALLGVLLSGGGYVSIDPQRFEAAQIGPDTLGPVLADTAPVCLLTTGDAQKLLPRNDIAVVLLEETERFPDEPVADADRISPLRPENTAYLMHSAHVSGLVSVTHRNVLELFGNARPLFDIVETDVWALSHSCAIDLSVWELWCALATGAAVVVIDQPTSQSPELFRELLIREQVTVLQLVPSEFDGLVEADRAADGSELSGAARLALRYVVSAGHELDPRSVRRWYERHTSEAPQLVTMYGLTETAAHVTFLMVDEHLADDPVSAIGRALPGSSGFVLDERLHPAPMGVAAEMYLAGGQLARGYAGRPGPTASRFVANPFGEPGSRMYRTGDTGRWIGFGGEAVLEYAGRREPFGGNAQVFSVVDDAITESVRKAATTGGPALTQALAAVVEDDPDAPALVSGPHEVSFAELDARSSRLARVLIDRDCGPGVGVAVRFERGIDAVVAVWAVLKVGAAVVFTSDDAPEPGVTVGLTAVPMWDSRIDWVALADPDVIAEVESRSVRPVTYADRTRALRGTDPAFVTADTILGYDELAAAVDRLRAGTELDIESRTFHLGVAQSSAAFLEIVAAGVAGAAMVFTENADAVGLAEEWVTHLFTDVRRLALLDTAPLEDVRAVVLEQGPVPAGGFGAGVAFMVLDELIR
ncbi:AMP-binding protein [Nocardia macrotermitis]|uniref:D-alanine--poly(Phosphoribitol) ligase subunit 1 n=1 Tax=Nocardia macrotermitis TaxID=2585198 RepID=A0A7K0DDX7_9NOCA|nr:AMP-binding protein [Nocardia macrotermitis]MQY23064.1 D-alanine--poly(phosphoribitol) ligase subunit 1 [Nocardia macrotermitis]